MGHTVGQLPNAVQHSPSCRNIADPVDVDSFDPAAGLAKECTHCLAMIHAISMPYCIFVMVCFAGVTSC